MRRNRLKKRLYPEVAQSTASPPALWRDRAFTLVELLIVITIIAMLATMTLLVVGSAQRATRISATEATIARIDAAICEMYETYGNRRVNTGQLPYDPDFPIDTFHPRNPQYSVNVAKARLHFLYDTMRMEMPQNSGEVVMGPQPLPYPIIFAGQSRGPSVHQIRTEDTSLRKVYERELAGVNDSNPYLFNAKLLYQIVMNGNPEAREMFTERGIAFDDNDGKPYFADAWGEPICFIRWAPGFIGSDRQPNMFKWTGYGSPDDNCKNYFEHWQEHISPDTIDAYDDTVPDYHPIKLVRGRYPDPLDVLGVRGFNISNNQPSSKPGWFLVPLVYSAGPDRKHGITPPSSLVRDPFDHDFGYGIPDGLDGEELDNIHNHRLGGR